MPMTSYVWVHPEAALSEEDRATLCAWTEQVLAARRGALPVPQEPPAHP
jgi:hypothetical protein